MAGPGGEGAGGEGDQTLWVQDGDLAFINRTSICRGLWYGLPPSPALRSENHSFRACGLLRRLLPKWGCKFKF